MENSRIDLSCYWNNRKKQLSGVFELVFFLFRVERNFRKINKNLRLFLKNKKTTEKNNFHKKIEKKF